MPKLYVGNLASSVTSRALASHFARAGEVLGALAIRDKASGLCRGFGFVEMAEFADLAVAFSLLNNSELDGGVSRSNRIRLSQRQRQECDCWIACGHVRSHGRERRRRSNSGN